MRMIDRLSAVIAFSAMVCFGWSAMAAPPSEIVPEPDGVCRRIIEPVAPVAPDALPGFECDGSAPIRRDGWCFRSRRDCRAVAIDEIADLKPADRNWLRSGDQTAAIFLAAYLDGDAARLDDALDRIARRGAQSMGPYAAFFGGADGIVETARQGRLGPLVAHYAVIRTAEIGLCGDQGVALREIITVTNETRNRLGAVLSSSSTSRPGDEFVVPAAFSGIVRAHFTRSPIEPDVREGLRRAARMFGCRSTLRRRLETNMRRYYAGAALERSPT